MMNDRKAASRIGLIRRLPIVRRPFDLVACLSGVVKEAVLSMN